MISRLLAVCAAFAMMLGGLPSINTTSNGNLTVSLATPAYADEGEPGEIYWVRAQSAEEAVESITGIIVRGDEARFGSKRNYTSFAYNPVTREMRVNEVVRPIGNQKNQSITTIIQLDTKMAVQRNEGGVVVARFQVGTEQMNGNAMLSQGLSSMLPALANGLGAAALQTIFNPCNGGGCGGGGATAISISDAAAQSIANTIVSGGAGCGSTPCTAGTRP